MKVACTVWSRGKSGDYLKGLPIAIAKKVTKDGKILSKYSYDSFGNRSSKSWGDDHQVTYQYNALNQLISSKDHAGTQQRYAYDKRGNLTEVFRNENLVIQHQYGALNRVEKTWNFEQNLGAMYKYNGFGKRVGKTEGTSLKPILSDSGLEHMTLNPTKQVEDVLDLTRTFNDLLTRKKDGNATNYTWEFDILSSSGVDGDYNYFLDDLGSPMRLVDGRGVEYDVFAFDEFGSSLEEPNPNHFNPFAFTGYRNDDIVLAGTYYAQAREYEPAIGRFTAQDTLD